METTFSGFYCTDMRHTAVVLLAGGYTQPAEQTAGAPERRTSRWPRRAPRTRRGGPSPWGATATSSSSSAAGTSTSMTSRCVGWVVRPRVVRAQAGGDGSSGDGGQGGAARRRALEMTLADLCVFVDDGVPRARRASPRNCSLSGEAVLFRDQPPCLRHSLLLFSRRTGGGPVPCCIALALRLP